MNTGKACKGMLLMAKKIYVGNMSYNTSEEELRDLFAQYGNVLSANIIIDRETRRPKGFGFRRDGRGFCCRSRYLTARR